MCEGNEVDGVVAFASVTRTEARRLGFSHLVARFFSRSCGPRALMLLRPYLSCYSFFVNSTTQVKLIIVVVTCMVLLYDVANPPCLAAVNDGLLHVRERPAARYERRAPVSLLSSRSLLEFGKHAVQEQAEVRRGRLATPRQASENPG